MKTIKFPDEFDSERIKVFDIINSSKMATFLWIKYLEMLIDDLKKIRK